MKIYILLCFTCLCSCKRSVPVSEPFHFPEQEEITLIFNGDIMQHMPQVFSAYKVTAAEYNYLSTFKYMAHYWTQADFSIANLETTLSDKDFSGYPKFRSPWQIVRDLHQCGVTTFVTANNHSCDQGEYGIKETIYYLDSLQIDHTGTFTDSIDYKKRVPLYLKKGKFKIALLNYTYGTNGLPIPEGCIVSRIDTNRILQEITKAKRDSASNIIAFMHWGYEYHTRPNTQQKKISQWLHHQGVDVVVGSHPHVIQPMEYITSGKDTVGITVYSLGNLISNQRHPYTNGGISVRLTLSRKSDGNCRYRMQYISHYSHRPYEREGRKYYIVPEAMADTILKGTHAVSGKKYFFHADSILDSAEKIKEPRKPFTRTN